MDKTIRKIKITGGIFRVILTIIIIIGIILSVSLFAAGIGLLVVPDDTLPEEYNRGLKDFIESGFDEDSGEAPADAKEALAELLDNVGRNSLSERVMIGIYTTGENTDELSVKILITLFALAISVYCLLMTIYSVVLRSMIKTLSAGERPFSVKAAKKLRRLAFLMLLLILVEPLSAVILFAVTLVFSLLFEYGAYLQDKADETSRIQEEMIMSFPSRQESTSAASPSIQGS